MSDQGIILLNGRHKQPVAVAPTEAQVEFAEMLQALEDIAVRNSEILARVVERFAALPGCLEAAVNPKEAMHGQRWVKLNDVLAFLREYKL